MKRYLLAALVAVTTPAWADVPGCGDEDVLYMVETIIRNHYFKHDKEPRELEFDSIRATDYNEGIDTYSCVLSMRFTATTHDLMVRKNLKDIGALVATVRYSVSPDAQDPDEFVIGLTRIRALEYGI